MSKPFTPNPEDYTCPSCGGAETHTKTCTRKFWIPATTQHWYMPEGEKPTQEIKGGWILVQPINNVIRPKDE